MKVVNLVYQVFFLLSNFVMAETISSKSKILKKSSVCIKDSPPLICKKLVSEIEKFQLVVFDQNRFKCQSSLLGLQSEIIEAYFFNNSSNERNSLMIPYVIKNC